MNQRSTLAEASARLSQLVLRPSDGVIVDAVNAISAERYPGSGARVTEVSSDVICARVRQLMQEVES